MREERTGPFPAGDHYSGSNPQWIWQQCLENEEFRVRVGDRIQKHLYNNDALTFESVRKLFVARAAEIESVVICESARWGDSGYIRPAADADRIIDELEIVMSIGDTKSTESQTSTFPHAVKSFWLSYSAAA